MKRIAPSEKPIILLAEDEEVYRCLISTVLQKADYDVLVTDNGKEALRSAERCPRQIDLLLTDVTMPEIEGPTLARRLQGMWRDLKVIVMSAHPPEMLSLDQSRTFMSKPFPARILLQRIREALPQPQRLRSEHRPLLRSECLGASRNETGLGDYYVVHTCR